MVTTIYNKRPNIDLLNEFYNEFVRYNNTDGKSLGIVLTPPHIVKLMCELLSIQSDDTVLDLCTGTGSFLLEAYTYHPKKIIGCEYQNKLFALLKCNMIIRNIQNYDIIQGNCFEHTFKAMKSLINPPYSMKDKSELEFILKQLESIDENGEACAIIPMSKISNSTKNTEHKSQILEIAHVKTIIVCRDTLFYPTASVHCVILHFVKSKKENRTNNETSILYYEDDGFDMIRQQGLMKNDTFEEKYENILKQCKEYMLNKVELNGEDDWVELDHTDSHDISELELKLYELELDYMEKKKQIISSFIPPSILPETKKIKLLDIFEIVKGPSRKLKDYESNGTYNIISSIDNNNGIHASKYATHKDYEPHCLTLNKNGSVGHCYYQSSPFIKTCDVIVLKSIQPMTKNAYIYFAIKITKVCTKRYSYSYKINQHRIQRILLDVPVTKDNEIDYQYIESII
jgi:predicted RNA methylase